MKREIQLHARLEEVEADVRRYIAEGSEVLRKVAAAEARTLRWVLDLPPVSHRKPKP